MNTNEIVKSAREAMTNDIYAPPMVTNSMLQAFSDEIERLQKELDAAKADIEGLGRFEKERCAYCLHDNNCEPGEMRCSYLGNKAFEWRGPQEAEKGIDNA